MVTRGDFIQNRLKQLGAKSAVPVLISHLVTLGGPSPAPNPPTAILPTIGVQNQGDTSVTINCQTASGRLVAGDKFTIQGITGTYKVLADNISSLDAFTNVPISPGLSAATNGQNVTFNWLNQQTVLVSVMGSNKTQVENDGTITVVIRLIVPANNLPFMPQIGDRCVISSFTYLIANITPIYAYGEPVAYNVLIK